MNSGRVTRPTLLQYGFIALPIAFAGFPLYVLAPDFYATRYDISLTLLGALLLLIRLVDAVQDPLIGWLTDKLHGRLLPLLVGAAVLLCLAVLGLFNTVLLSPAAWFITCMFVAVSAYSVLVIALGAQATLWTENRDEQTRIAGAREAFGLVGLVVAVSLPITLSYLVAPDQIYVWYTIILALLMMAGIAGFASFSAGLPALAVPGPKRSTSPLSALRALPKASLQLFGVYALSMLASSIPVVLVIFYVRDLLGAEQLTGAFLLLYFLAGAAAMPLWKYLSIRVGKYQAWGISNILAVAGFLSAFFLDAGEVWPYAAICVVSGLALGADLTLPPSLLAEHIHQHGNKAFSGTHYAYLAFISKASLALASALTLPVLDLAGFTPQAANSALALTTLSTAYALVPCVLKLMAAILLYVFFVRPQPSGVNNEDFSDHRNNRSSHHA